MTSLPLTQSLQDYLEVILNLSEEEEAVRVTDIAKRLNIAKASVNQAMNTLKDLNLIVQEKYGPVRLTEKGREEAAKVWYKHQILYDFLVNVLAVDPVIASKDACSMEHVVSPQTMKRLVEFLNNYKGINTAVQNEEKKVKSLSTSALSELTLGARAKVISVTASGSLRRRILEMGVIPGAEIKIDRIAPMGDPIEVVVKGYHLSLRKEEAASVVVEVL